MYPSGLTWFHLSRAISPQSVPVNRFHHSITPGRWFCPRQEHDNDGFLFLFSPPLRSLSDQLFHVLAMHMRLYSIDSAYNPWTKLTQVTQDREAE